MTEQTDLAPPPLATDGLNLRRTAILDLALPFVTVVLLQRWGAAPLTVYAAAAIFPIGSIVVAWVARRSVDIVGVFVLVGIASGLGTALLAGDPRFALLRAAPSFALFGILCLVSLPTRRPLMFFVGRAFAAASDRTQAAAWDARVAQPGFRRAMRFLTLVWGTSALAAAAAGVCVAFLLAGRIAIVAEPVVAIGTVLALLGYTRGFARRAQTRRS
jgi:hypothetical protein